MLFCCCCCCYCYCDVEVPYRFWKLTPYLIYGLQIFPPFSRLPFQSIGCFLCCVTAYYLESHLYIYASIALVFSAIVMKLLSSQMSWFSPMFPYRSFIVSGFKDFNLGLVDFVYSVRFGCKFIHSFFCMWISSFPNTIHCRDYIFSIWYSWHCVEDQLVVYAWMYFWSLYSVTVVYILIYFFIPVP